MVDKTVEQPYKDKTKAESDLTKVIDNARALRLSLRRRERVDPDKWAEQMEAVADGMISMADNIEDWAQDKVTEVHEERKEHFTDSPAWGGEEKSR